MIFIFISLFVFINCIDVPPHPRVLVSDSQIQIVKTIIKNGDDEVVTKWFESLLLQTNGFLTDNYKFTYTPNAAAMLATSREMLNRIVHLGGMYRISDDKKYVETAVRYLLEVSAFPDWYPNQFLDVAEMAGAVGIGYDWFYTELNDSVKATVESALTRYALQPGLSCYLEDNKPSGDCWWTKVNFNWNIVCNGGLLMAAISVWDKVNISQDVFTHILKSISYSIVSYNPDGGWIEGPTYWDYATRYVSYFFASLLNAFGSDFNLLKLTPGLAYTGNFRIQTTDPKFLLMDNFADSSETVGHSWCMIWLGHFFHNKNFVAHERSLPSLHGGSDMEHLLFSLPEDKGIQVDWNQIPLDAYFKDINVVIMRTSWTDLNAIWLPIKGGNTNANHQHLDLGSFILEGYGQRFISDPGAGSYELPGYFDIKERYKYYRTSSLSHSVLTFNGDFNQIVGAKSDVINFQSSTDKTITVVDLTEAYAKNATNVTRTFSFDKRSKIIVVEDQIIPNSNTKSVIWRVHTVGDIILDHNMASLKVNGTSLKMNIVNPVNASWSWFPYNPPPPQRQIPDWKELRFEVEISSPISLNVQLEFQ